MGSQHLVSQQLTCVQQKIFFFEYIHRKLTIIIMKVAICFTCVFAMAYAESWMAAPYTLIVKRAAQPEPQNTRFNFGNRPSSSSSSNNANTRFFTETEPLMPVLLELPLDLLVNMLPIRFSIHALEVATEIKTLTTEFLEEIQETFFWELLEDSLQLLSLMLLLEVLVEDKIFHHI